MKGHGLKVMKAATVAALGFATSGWAVPPQNPSFEDNVGGPPLHWTVSGPGTAVAVTPSPAGDLAPDGENYLLMYFEEEILGHECGIGFGPLVRSSTFSAAAGETVSVDMTFFGAGDCCDNPSNYRDVGVVEGWLCDAQSGVQVANFFNWNNCGTSWHTYTANAPAAGNYYLEFLLASEDCTCGGAIGAEMHIDNVRTSGSPPDCSAAQADTLRLWPPEHNLQDIHISGVTDPDGGPVTITVDSIYQDEPTNSEESGNTCPDASGIGTDTAQVRAERVGGGEGSESNGRTYRIFFTATDDSGATCNGTVTVGVPLNRTDTVVDDGPLFDATACP